MNSVLNPRLLRQAAVDAAALAYCRYSGYRVGAALVTEDGTLYTGSNIENSSNPASICAERTAISQAISDGHRRLAALAVFTPVVPHDMGDNC